MKRTYYWVIIAILIAGAAGTNGYLAYLHRTELDKVRNARLILISKQEMRLRLIDYKGNELFSAPVAVGMNAGNKQKIGDMCTPEGVFQVVDIQHASDWEHDFDDGKGKVKGAYGDYFIRLEVPGHKGIGIHGTHFPESIGTRASEGCIRMNNEELNRLVALIYPPLTVVITPGAEDEKRNCNSK
ncbi:MAG: L,D-transpeptidase [Tannerellaceae bacterium]